MKNIKCKKLFASLVTLILVSNSAITVASADFNSDEQAVVYSVQARLRELGYFNYRPTATYGEMTKAIVNTFRVKNSLGTSNLLDEQTYNQLFKSAAVRKVISPEISLPIGPQTSSAHTAGGKSTAFSEIKNSVNVGDTFTVEDYITGKSLTLKRTGGENHFDTDLAGSSNITNLKEIFGNTFTWEKRSAVAVINGARIAAAMSVFQDGSTTKIIVYFTGSSSDIMGTLDVEYAEKILQAVE